MRKHTPEPWSKEDFQRFPFTDITQRGLQIEDFARAVACVNACAGLYDPETVIRCMKSIKVGRDFGPHLEDLFKEMEKLKAQRDELLAHLEALTKAIKFRKAIGQDIGGHELIEAETAIAKVKGGQS